MIIYVTYKINCTYSYIISVCLYLFLFKCLYILVVINHTNLCDTVFFLLEQKMIHDEWMDY